MVATFRNRLAVFFWIFAVAWIGGLSAMTWAFFRDGPPGHSPPIVAGVLALFWAMGVFLCVVALRKACLRVAVGADGAVSVTWRFPFKVVRKSFSAAALRPAVVVTSRDTDGDPYFRARVDLIGGDAIDIAEGSNRGQCARACERFNAAVFPPSPARGPATAAG